MKPDVMFSRQTDEWSTPQDFFDELNREFEFSLDAAADNGNAKCEHFMSRETNALACDWLAAVELLDTRAVWVNPPYSQCREFIAKSAEEARKGCTVVCLVPSRTDTRWWVEHVWDHRKHELRPGVQIRFIKGRLKFGGSTNSAPFPSVVIIFRPVQA